MIGSRSDSRYPSDWDQRRRKVYKRDGYKCQKCGRKGGKKGSAQLHAHHIKPISEGGSHSYRNLMTVCHSCHEKIHGHGIPTKGKSSSSASTWKKAVWLPSWESSDSEDADLDEIIEPLRRENSRSREDWIARQIGALMVFLVMISPGLWVVWDSGMVYGGIFATIFAVLMMPILFMLIPILGIPLILISLLAGTITWLIARYGLEKYYSENDSVR